MRKRLTIWWLDRMCNSALRAYRRGEKKGLTRDALLALSRDTVAYATAVGLLSGRVELEVVALPFPPHEASN